VGRDEWREEMRREEEEKKGGGCFGCSHRLVEILNKKTKHLVAILYTSTKDRFPK
jgi:hypothetical protein